jgi:nicotinate-nucleotide adenylyltransferase
MPATSAQHRLAMVRLAVLGNPHFHVSDLEARQRRVAYTIETLEHFRGQRRGVTWYFVAGSDELRNLPRWKDSRRLRRLCRFIGLNRLEPFASPDIRRRIKQGRSIRYQVPDSVERYIRRHRLYRSS